MSFEKFHWTAPNGDEIVLPYLDKVPGSLIRKNRKLDPMDLLFTVMETVADEATIAKVDALEFGQQKDMFEAWQEATAPVGESSRSST